MGFKEFPRPPGGVNGGQGCYTGNIKGEQLQVLTLEAGGNFQPQGSLGKLAWK